MESRTIYIFYLTQKSMQKSIKSISEAPTLCPKQHHAPSIAYSRRPRAPRPHDDGRIDTFEDGFCRSRRYVRDAVLRRMPREQPGSCQQPDRSRETRVPERLEAPRGPQSWGASVHSSLRVWEDAYKKWMCMQLNLETHTRTVTPRASALALRARGAWSPSASRHTSSVAWIVPRET